MRVGFICAKLARFAARTPLPLEYVEQLSDFNEYELCLFCATGTWQKFKTEAAPRPHVLQQDGRTPHRVAPSGGATPNIFFLTGVSWRCYWHGTTLPCIRLVRQPVATC